MKHRCVFCGAPEQIIWVHGHGQCAHCKTNSFPCCDGDECIPVKATAPSPQDKVSASEKSEKAS